MNKKNEHWIKANNLEKIKKRLCDKTVNFNA